MIPLARKFFRRPVADRRLLVRALILHTCVAALLRVVRFGRLRRWLDAAGAVAVVGDRRLDSAAMERIIRAVRQAGAAVPLGRTCLTEALTAAALLRRAGCATTLHYGVAPDGGGVIAAHAWLEYRGAVVMGGTARPYAPLGQAGRAA